MFKAITQDLRRILRLLEGRQEEPSAAIYDSRTPRSTPESGGRAGYDGVTRTKGSKVRQAVDALDPLLSVRVTAANEQGWDQVGELSETVISASRARPRASPRGAHGRSR
ncbi:MAG TPA: hypothetical protein VF796_01245 [Humisphaera sp.]